MDNLPVKASDYGLEESQARELTSNLPQILEERKAMESQYDEIIKLDINNPTTAKLARELRLMISKNRTQGIAPWHKTHKEYFLQGGRFVDAIKNKEEAVNKRMEENLSEIEKYQENLEAARLKAIEDERKAVIAEYSEIIPSGLSTMEQDTFDKYVIGLKAAKEAEIKAAKAEELRLKKEKELQEEIAKRKLQLSSLIDFIEDYDSIDFSMPEKEFKAIVKKASDDKAAYEARQESIRIENERLRKEAEEIKKKRTERAEELKPYIVFIRDYNALIEADDDKYAKELSDIKIGAEQHWEHELKKAKERDEQEAEIARKQAEYEKNALILKRQERTNVMIGVIGNVNESYLDVSDEVFNNYIIRAKAEIEEKAKATPDSELLTDYMKALFAVKKPTMSTEKGLFILDTIDKLMVKIKGYVDQKITEI